MKGILLAGGRATRLYPITKGVCKHMLAIYDKPMVYYPLSVLLLSGIRDIMLISTAQDLPRFKTLLGDGKGLGINLRYAVQKNPGGIAESFIIAKEFIGKDSVCLVLGDNIFYGHDLINLLQEAAGLKQGAVIFGYYVKDPKRYGVIEFDKDCNVISLTEKPKVPKSNYVVTGLYFYDNDVVNIAKSLKPSKRKELEITDVNNAYLKKNKLIVKLLGRGYAWLDTGTPDSLIEASMFIKTIEERQGLKIGCVEEAAYRMGYISKKNLLQLLKSANSSYAEYLKGVLND
ncbi:MAG: glucose-1-phosphate thymidylyltransferase [Omnitrophica WOR_2 bacterium RBG_13_44_8b]|nr:MAG: glucose-1-phosphate thymidylyltransferase [Omnitrophica WOR_2 bacterium RBG_13_44_8b]